MSQKYRLAVALAVLKSKPENLPIQQYIINIQDKINQPMDTDDFDSICSDDFNFDDDFNDNDVRSNNENDSVTILRDIDLINDESKSLTDVKRLLREVDDNTIAAKAAKSNQTTTHKNQHNSNSEIYNRPSKSNLNNSETIAFTIEESNEQTDKIAHENNRLANVIARNLSKEFITDKHKQIFEQPMTDPKDTDSLVDQTVVEVNRNLDERSNNLEPNVNVDSQATMAYSIDDYTQNFTHVSQSQFDNFEFAEKYIFGTGPGDNQNFAEIQLPTDFGSNLTEPHLSFLNENGIQYEINGDRVTEKGNASHETQIHKENITKSQYFSQINERELQSSLNFSNETVIDDERAIKSQKTTVNEANETNTFCHNAVTQKTASGTQKVFQTDRNNKNNVTETQNSTQSAHTINLDTKMVQVINENGRKYLVLDRNLEKNICDKNVDTTLNTEDSFEDKISQTELIPYKVVEELNMVKNFLNKEQRASGEGYSSDSEYRSDSLSKGSCRNSIHLSENWLNQSAHSLLSYILQCPLLGSTQEIINEISQVLGRLVDRLHEEETYPSFLEDVLENVNMLLGLVFEGDTDGENMLLYTDERMQRLLLLNRSLHIIKYSLEKITNILENIHANLTVPDSMYELTNIQKTENTSYIFHILEILLQRYLKVKNTTTLNWSQSSSQNTQERLFKRSCITEMWRKKWNPNYKECSAAEVVEKKCVAAKCSEVLNKIVVGCMGGYSLVAFAALQCFNLLQLE